MANRSEEVLKEWAKKHTSPVTNQAVEPVLTNANERYVLDYIFVAGDAAGSLQILDDTNTAVDGYFFPFAAGGNVQISGRFLNKLPRKRGIRYTTASGGNHAVIIKYHLASGPV